MPENQQRLVSLGFISNHSSLLQLGSPVPKLFILQRYIYLICILWKTVDNIPQKDQWRSIASKFVLKLNVKVKYQAGCSIKTVSVAFEEKEIPHTGDKASLDRCG